MKSWAPWTLAEMNRTRGRSVSHRRMLGTWYNWTLITCCSFIQAVFLVAFLRLYDHLFLDSHGRTRLGPLGTKADNSASLYCCVTLSQLAYGNLPCLLLKPYLPISVNIPALSSLSLSEEILPFKKLKHSIKMTTVSQMWTNRNATKKTERFLHFGYFYPEKNPVGMYSKPWVLTHLGFCRFCLFFVLFLVLKWYYSLLILGL